MRFIKWLWSIGVAMAVVLIYATVSSYMVDAGEWYAALLKPLYAPSGTLSSVLWCVCYCDTVYVLARLLVGKRGAAAFWLVAARGALNVAWCAVFFVAHSLLWSVIIIGVTAAYTAAAVFYLIKKDGVCSLCLTGEFVWLCFLFAVNYCMLMLN